ncbi:MAG: hypothetical protein ACREBU_04335 [Nitrososphaera sp.]
MGISFFRYTPGKLKRISFRQRPLQQPVQTSPVRIQVNSHTTIRKLDDLDYLNAVRRSSSNRAGSFGPKWSHAPDQNWAKNNPFLNTRVKGERVMPTREWE